MSPRDVLRCVQRQSKTGCLQDRERSNDGDIETLAHTAQQLPLTNPDTIAQRTTALAYFTTNAHRMRYAYFRDLAMFVGSGAVEAGCKAVIGQRLKLSGMRWNVPGATGVERRAQ